MVWLNSTGQSVEVREGGMMRVAKTDQYQRSGEVLLKERSSVTVGVTFEGGSFEIA